MARITAQGRLKVISRGNGAAFEHRSPLNLQIGSNGGGCTIWVDSYPLQPHKSRPRKIDHSKARIFALSATDAGLSLRFDAGEASGEDGHVGCGDYDDFEFENDELSCFRGLVLNVSYRLMY